MFSTVYMLNSTCLLATVHALFSNLTRSPEDRFDVFRSMRALGDRHPSFIEFLAEDLLQIDRRFAPPEPNVDDLICG